MPRPMGAARQALLHACQTQGGASAFDAARTSGFTSRQMRYAASNARRAGQIAPAGLQSRAGADRPAVVWQAARSDAAQDASPWFVDLGVLCR